MTPKQLRELDAWIGLNVMGWTKGDVAPSKWFPDGWKDTWIHPRGGAATLPQFTTNPAAALAVLEKCARRPPSTVITPKSDGSWIIHASGIDTCLSKGETLPLAICLFARQIFSA